jgi:hypothetical protein
MLRLDDAMAALANFDPRKAKVVELPFLVDCAERCRRCPQANSAATARCSSRDDSVKASLKAVSTPIVTRKRGTKEAGADMEGNGNRSRRNYAIAQLTKRAPSSETLRRATLKDLGEATWASRRQSWQA